MRQKTSKRLKDIFFSGKNSKLLFYLKNYPVCAIPRRHFAQKREEFIRKQSSVADMEAVMKRVNYYNRLSDLTPLPQSSPRLGTHTLKNKRRHTTYFLDTYNVIKWFDGKLQWQYLYGDIVHIPTFPTIVKSRPVHGDNSNSILLNLNKIRHFLFIEDPIPWQEKQDKIVFRGVIDSKPNRIEFVRRFKDHPRCDAGDTDDRPLQPAELKKPLMTIKEHLRFKFVACLEGNDVATNLKWVMSSNCLPVMPMPRYETWFMEGTLIPDYHFVLIKDDFSDLFEKMDYYNSHPEKAEAIIRHNHEYIRQFSDPGTEELIALLVMEKYFEKTGQTPEP